MTWRIATWRDEESRRCAVQAVEEAWCSGTWRPKRSWRRVVQLANREPPSSHGRRLLDAMEADTGRRGRDGHGTRDTGTDWVLVLPTVPPLSNSRPNLGRGRERYTVVGMLWHLKIFLHRAIRRTPQAYKVSEYYESSHYGIQLEYVLETCQENTALHSICQDIYCRGSNTIVESEFLKYKALRWRENPKEKRLVLQFRVVCDGHLVILVQLTALQALQCPLHPCQQAWCFSFCTGFI